MLDTYPNKKESLAYEGSFHLLGLQVGVFAGDVLETRAGLVRVEVVVAYDEGLGVPAPQASIFSTLMDEKPTLKREIKT